MRKKPVIIPENPLTSSELNKLLSFAYNSARFRVENYGTNTATLKDKLHQRGFPKEPLECEDGSFVDIINVTVQQLIDEGVLNEEELVRHKANYWYSKGYSESSTVYRLLLKRFDEEVVKVVVPDVYSSRLEWDTSPFEIAAKEVIKKSRKIAYYEKAKFSFVSGMYKRGFSYLESVKWFSDNYEG